MSLIRVNQLQTTDGSVTVDVADLVDNAALLSEELAKGDALVTVLTPSSGGVARTQHSKNQDFVTAADFGATADGMYHPLSERYSSLALAQAVYPFVTSLTQSIDYAALQSAVNATISVSSGQPGSFNVKGGDYVITDTISTAGPVDIRGEGSSTRGVRIRPHTSFSGAALFTYNFSGTTRNVTFLGNSSVDGILANANMVTVDECSFIGCRRSVTFDTTNPVFYFSALNCLFYDCGDSHILVANTSTGGVDMILDNCRFLDSFGNYCFNFAQGLGSIIASNLQISVTGTQPSQQLVNWGVPAPGFGGAQITNTVFEGGGGTESMVFGGTSTYPWKEMHFGTCFFTGFDVPALAFNYVDGVTFDNCVVSSANTTQIIKMAAGVDSKDIKFIGCGFEGTGGAPVFKSVGATTIQLTIDSPRWGGSAVLCDFSNVPATQLFLRINGGAKPLPSPVVSLLSEGATDYHLSWSHPTYGNNMSKILSGTMTGTSQTIAHGITSLHQKLLSATGFYRGGSGELLPLSITNVDGNNIVVGGGVSGRSYVIRIEYSGKAWNTA